MISFTKIDLPFGWLSNMSRHAIEYNGRIWRTAEALFQSMRFSDNTIINSIWQEKSPMGAKMVAKKNKDKMVVEPLCKQDLENMMIVLDLKVKQHPELKEELLKTGNEIIIEDVTARQRSNNMIWGMAKINDNWVGKNILGKMWMKIRKNLE